MSFKSNSQCLRNTNIPLALLFFQVNIVKIYTVVRLAHVHRVLREPFLRTLSYLYRLNLRNAWH